MEMLTECVRVTYKNTTRMECGFEHFLHVFVNFFQFEMDTMHYIRYVECGLLLLFWGCTLTMKRDVTKSFLIPVGLLLTAGAAMGVFYDHVMRTGALFNYPMQIIQTSVTWSLICIDGGKYTFAVGSVMYSVCALRTACSRKPPAHGCITCIPFVLLAAAITAASAMCFYDNVHQEAIKKSFIQMGAMPLVYAGYISLSAMFACCCKPKPDMPLDDPVVWNAKSRYFWCIPLLISAFLVCSVDLASTILATMNDDIAVVMSQTQVLIPIAVFLFLPAYRSKLFFGCCLDTQTSTNSVVPVTDEQPKSVQSHPLPVQSMPTHMSMYHPMSIPPTANFPVVHSYGAPPPPPFHHQHHQHHVYAMPNYANPIVIG